MRHQCTSCLREFFDDAPPARPRQHVYCVFCGTQLPLPSPTAGSAVPFSPEVEREQDFALGVIGASGSGFPDTLRQFRAHGSTASSKHDGDSLMPLLGEVEDSGKDTVRAPWRLGSFWTSLGIGFAVGALAAIVAGASAHRQSAPGRAAVAPPSVASNKPRPLAANSAATAPLAQCSATPSVATMAAPAAKAPSTPALERRFWLERARAAQRSYRLDDAERSYRRALAQAPQDSEALAGLGELELLRGATTLASERFQAALAVNADYVPALVAVADIHWQAGHAEEARQAYREIVERYSPDLYPPYVILRSQAACVPQCQ